MLDLPCAQKHRVWPTLPHRERWWEELSALENPHERAGSPPGAHSEFSSGSMQTHSADGPHILPSTAQGCFQGSRVEGELPS